MTGALRQRCARGPEHIVQLACTVFGTENALVALLEGEVRAPPSYASRRAVHARRGWATRTRRVWHATRSDRGLVRLQRIFIRNATGKFSPGDFPWRYSFCGYTLVPKNPTAMVIEDALEDARCAATQSCRPLSVLQTFLQFIKVLGQVQSALSTLLADCEFICLCARFRNNAFVSGGVGVRFYVGTPLVRPAAAQHSDDKQLCSAPEAWAAAACAVHTRTT